MNVGRDAFLARVREAARSGAKYRVDVEPVPEDVGYCGAGDDPPSRLVAEVNAVGGQGLVVADRAAARAALAELLARYSPAKALCWRHPFLDALGLDELLASRNIAQIDHRVLEAADHEQRRGEMLAADIGITSATVAIAETGTLAMASGPGTERVASLLPPIHIAVIGADQIVPDLFDFFAAMQESSSDMPSNWVLITGPSKTGDLELKLTTGVHGPGHWHVIVVREP
ncbi:MAG TPA: lactate utilization protein [Pirellulales bacterium]|nr:lactate utilization protein [Pirellulales bacterium]